ncbi:hypothetical protein ACV331_35695, partial [Pseudomonas aeruginosa]
LGERTCAFVIPRQPAPSALKLKQYLHACGLAAFKVPDRIELVPAFPQTGIGVRRNGRTQAALMRGPPARGAGARAGPSCWSCRCR